MAFCNQIDGGLQIEPATGYLHKRNDSEKKLVARWRRTGVPTDLQGRVSS
jgi:hypothetical protein